MASLERPGFHYSFSCCLQDLAPVMMKALFLPCLDSAQKAPESTVQPGCPRMGSTQLDVHRLRCKLLSMIPSVVKCSSDSSWFWRSVMPRCEDWLGSYVDWMIAAGRRSTLDNGPYLAMFGELSIRQMPSCSTLQAFLGHVNVCLYLHVRQHTRFWSIAQAPLVYTVTFRAIYERSITASGAGMTPFCCHNAGSAHLPVRTRACSHVLQNGQ